MKAKKVGDYGEDIVLRYFEEEGYEVKKSHSEFDMQKDIVVTRNEERLTVEVKARTVFRMYNSFLLDMNQWYKADTAHRLVFVSVPANTDEPIILYDVPDRECYKEETIRGKTVRSYPLTKLKKLKTIRDQEVIKEFYDLGFSKIKATS